MDSLKTLIEKKQYDLVLDLTKDSKDPTSTIYRISALLGLQKPKEALDLFLRVREELYKQSPLKTIQNDFELRFINNDFDGAYADLDLFKDKPYVSQEVEEYLRLLPSLIRKNERDSELNVDKSDDELINVLENSKDDYEILSTLSFLENRDLAPFISSLKKLLISSHHPSVKTFGLLLLVSKHYQGEVNFLKGKKEYHLVPEKLDAPFSGLVFDGFISNLKNMAKNPSASQVAISILSDYIIDEYPEPVIKESTDYTLMLALLKISGEYLHDDLQIEDLIKEHNLTMKDVTSLADKISKTLKEEPVLKI
jgi:hypothetical protein